MNKSRRPQRRRASRATVNLAHAQPPGPERPPAQEDVITVARYPGPTEDIAISGAGLSPASCTAVATRLAERHAPGDDGTWARTIETWVAEEAGRFAEVRIHDFVSILVENNVRRRLRTTIEGTADALP